MYLFEKIVPEMTFGVLFLLGVSGGLCRVGFRAGGDDDDRERLLSLRSSISGPTGTFSLSPAPTG